MVSRKINNITADAAPKPVTNLPNEIPVRMAKIDSTPTIQAKIVNTWMYELMGLSLSLGKVLK